MNVVAGIWRAVLLFRVLALCIDALRVVLSAGADPRPGWAWAALAVAAAWTAASVAVFAAPSRRRPAWLVLDTAVVLAVVVLAFGSNDAAAVGDRSLPLLWASSTCLMWGVSAGWVAGALSAVPLGLVQWTAVGRLTGAAATATATMALGGALLGLAARLGRDAEQAVARATAAEAQQRERERLSRAVHDGVLQVLGLVAHRGPELGPEGARLARLATEQEIALRALISRLPAPAGGGGDAGTSDVGVADLGELLVALGSPAVSVAVPADPVPWPEDAARETVAAVRAALDNVTRHAGAGAHAWVLLEDEGERVVVSVRDNGVGLPPGRLEQAAATGRMGVAGSIVRRVAALGGVARITGAPGRGTEVELALPRGGGHA